MKNILLAALVAFNIALPAKGEEPKAKIESAFGLKLGDKFDITKATKVGEFSDKEKFYHFKPEKPFRSLTEYYVVLTPQSDLIYKIVASGEFEGTGMATKEGSVISHLLEKKYGAFDKSNFGLTMAGAKVITQSHRQLMIDVDEAFGGKIRLTYLDEALEKKADAEYVAIEAAKADASGL